MADPRTTSSSAGTLEENSAVQSISMAMSGGLQGRDRPPSGNGRAGRGTALARLSLHPRDRAFLRLPRELGCPYMTGRVAPQRQRGDQRLSIPCKLYI